MKFKKYITELFKTDIPLERSFSRKRKKDFSSRFKIEDITYYFQAEYYPGVASRLVPKHEGYYDIVFGVASAPKELRAKIQGSFELTGLGHAPRVLAGVMKSFREFIKERNPEILKFAAIGDRGRMKVYDRFAKWIESTYKFSYMKRPTASDEIEWLFYKPREEE
jgi:hypothetical protein